MSLPQLTWMVCESEACPRISSRAGSDTKKNRGNTRRFFSRYPVKDFWHISSCSRRWGRSWLRVSSPTQHWTTLGFSWARCMIFTHDLSMLEKRLASWITQKRGGNEGERLVIKSNLWDVKPGFVNGVLQGWIKIFTVFWRLFSLAWENKCGIWIPGKLCYWREIFAIFRGNLSFRWIFLSFSDKNC